MNNKGIKDTIYSCKHCGKQFPFKGYSFNHIFCSIDCNKEYRLAKQSELLGKRYEDWLNGISLGLAYPRSLIKKFVIQRDGYHCSVCNITEWQGKPISLWCDHIDGDASNNQASNFRLICPNCDSQSDTFGAKNTGKGRKARGLPQYG